MKDGKRRGAQRSARPTSGCGRAGRGRVQTATTATGAASTASAVGLSEFEGRAVFDYPPGQWPGGTGESPVPPKE